MHGTFQSGAALQFIRNKKKAKKKKKKRREWNNIKRDEKSKVITKKEENAGPLAFRNTKKKCNFLYALSPVSHLHSSMRAGRISLDCHLIPNESLPISNSNVQLRLSWSYFATSSFKRHNKLKRTEEKNVKTRRRNLREFTRTRRKVLRVEAIMRGVLRQSESSVYPSRGVV